MSSASIRESQVFIDVALLSTPGLQKPSADPSMEQPGSILGEDGKLINKPDELIMVMQRMLLYSRTILKQVLDGERDA